MLAVPVMPLMLMTWPGLAAALIAVAGSAFSASSRAENTAGSVPTATSLSLASPGGIEELFCKPAVSSSVTVTGGSGKVMVIGMGDLQGFALAQQPVHQTRPGAWRGAAGPAGLREHVAIPRRRDEQWPD